MALPPVLPRVDVIHELPDDAHHCHDDGTALKVIGEEVSEELHVVPARIEVIAMCNTICLPAVRRGRQHRPAPANSVAQEQCQRHAARLYRDGYDPALTISRARSLPAISAIPGNTLARWMVQAGERIIPLIDTLHQHLLNAPLIHMDETTLQVNQEADRAASATSYMWVQRGGPPGQQVVLPDYAANHAGRVPVACGRLCGALNH